MKMKKGLLVVVVLLAMASLMAAMAYNSAYVHNPTTLKIASTDEALLAIAPGSGIGNYDLTSYVDKGVMYVDFGKGIGGEMFGLQPGSGYTWDNLFRITNNSEEDLTYRFTVGNNELVKHLTITENESNKVVFNQDNASPYIRLESGETRTFKVSIWLHQLTKLETLNGTIQVNAFAQD